MANEDDGLDAFMEDRLSGNDTLMGNDCSEFEGEAEFPDDFDEPREDYFRDDVEADADTLASAGYGTNEDYGDFGGDEGE